LVGGAVCDVPEEEDPDEPPELFWVGAPLEAPPGAEDTGVADELPGAF